MQTEMSRAVRVALWDYRPGVAFTSTCDKDIEVNCPRVSRMWSKAGRGPKHLRSKLLPES